MSIRKIDLNILRIFIITILALSLYSNLSGSYSARYAASHLVLDVSSDPSGAWIYFDDVNTSLKTNSSFEPPITRPGSHKLMFISENRGKIGSEILFNSSLEKIEANFLYKMLLISFNIEGRTTCLKIDTI